jgi:MFS family permease
MEPIQSVNDSIESESPELSVGENVGWWDHVKNAFPAFNSRNYQLYFAGQLVSLVGTWLQIVAEGWLVFQLTGSAFYVGLDAAAATVPSLFLSLIGGLIVDRYPKKIIIMCTQSASMILAFTLGVLAVTHVVTVWEIIVLAFGLGIVNAIDSPARQAYVTELIDNKGSLASAIALNSGVFNAARVIGPSIAGLLIAAVGTGMAFILNGVSYIAVIIALHFITTPLTIAHIHANPVTAIKDGLRYAYNHTVIRTLIILAGVVSIFGWSYSTLMPVIATRTFHVTAAGLGYMYAAAGLGALTGTIIISAFSRKINRINFILTGTMVFATALILFTFVSNVPIALVLLFAIGTGLVSQFAMINTVIQHEVEDSMRGRVLSLYTFVFIGLSPLGSLGIGWAAERFGSQLSMRVSAAVVLMLGVYLFVNRRRIALPDHAV